MIQAIELGSYDLERAIRIIYTNNKKLVFTQTNYILEKLSEIYDTKIKNLDDIKNKKIINANVKITGGIPD